MKVQIIDANGTVLATLDVSAEKRFSTGSRGFFAGGKVTINGKRYQVTVPLVEIGSKPGK